MKVSFDFDGTLSKKVVRDYAKGLISSGIEVWVVTARFEKPSQDIFRQNYTHDDLFELTDELTIPRDRVKFTNMVDKYEFFCENEDFIFHLDDLHPEIALISEYCKQVKGIWLYNFSIEKNEWLKECDKLIENNS
jgi:hypothetical protein